MKKPMEVIVSRSIAPLPEQTVLTGVVRGSFVKLEAMFVMVLDVDVYEVQDEGHIDASDSWTAKSGGRRQYSDLGAMIKDCGVFLGRTYRIEYLVRVDGALVPMSPIGFKIEKNVHDCTGPFSGEK